MISIDCLAKALKGKLYLKEDKILSSLEFDSREVKKDSAFFTFNGIHTNGNNYIEDAIQNGAALIVTKTLPQTIHDDVSYFVSDENIRELYALSSSLFFNNVQSKLKIIGVTGTDGKTTTTDFLYQLLNSFGHKTAMISTVYIDDGSGKKYSTTRQSTPEAFFLHSFLYQAYSNNCEYVVMETTSHALSNEYCRVKGISFTSSIYTTVSSEHLEFHKSLENYYDAKANLAHNTLYNVVIYNDSPILDKINRIAKHKVVELTKPEITDERIDSTSFYVDGIKYSIPLFGSYNVYNAFEAAILVSRLLKLPKEVVLSKLKNLEAPKGRFNTYSYKNKFVIIDFAHTPDSFEKLFSSFRKVFPNKEITAVFGAAGDRDKSKRKGLGKVASTYASNIILTEEDPRSENVLDISLDIIEGIPEERRKKIHIYTEDQREAAIKLALTISAPDGVIFLLGKGHERSISYKINSRNYLEEDALLNILKENVWQFSYFMAAYQANMKYQ